MSRGRIAWILTGLLLVGGCGGLGSTTYLHPQFDFAFVERVAVVPFENLSEDQGAGARATRYFTGDLLASEAFEVIEPGETARVLAQHSVIRTGQMTEAQIKAVGRELGVQGLFLGTLNESATIRRGNNTVNVVTVVVRLIETETGSTVWSATTSDDSQGFWSSLFGTGQKSRSEVTRSCLKRCLDTLID